MNSVDIKFIKRLSETSGVSGREDNVRNLIKAEIEPCCDTLRVDNIGNLIAQKKGKNNRNILLTASMDEAGFIITGVKEGGGAFLRFAPVGKIKPQSVVSETVVIGDKLIPGIISLKAVHLTTKEEREKPVKLTDLFIDVGADKKEDVSDILTGDYAGFKSRYSELGSSCICNKAIGQRACCGILAQILKDEIESNITCVFTVQKQTGLRGARLSFDIDEKEFDAAIVIDTVENEDVKPGDGAIVPMMINESCPDRRIAAAIKEIAEKRGRFKAIAKKTEDSDLTGLCVKGTGILAAEIDIPVKNKDTSSEIADKNDINTVYETVYEYLNK